MNSSQSTSLLALLSLCLSSCNIDEIPPEIVVDLRGWFTIESNNIGVNLAWSEVPDEDIDKYIIFKSTNNTVAQEIGETQSNYFKDNNVEWLESYQYFIKSVDDIGNESALSDSVLVRVYSASGNWELSDYDSTFLCIDHNQVISTSSGSFQQKGYFLTDGYELIINDDSDDSTSSVGDTIISKMLFSSCNLDSNTWAGNGWMTFKDASNSKSNQTLRSENVVHLSNLCTEIIEVTSNDECAVCNLGSVNLARHTTEDGVDFEALRRTVRLAMFALDRVIDLNFYPLDIAKNSNLKWRPVGLGLMGLQDAFFKLGLRFDSEEAKTLSTKISEEIYYAALDTSCELAEQNGAHPNFNETRAAQGELQFDLWGVQPEGERWKLLKERIAEHGLRNSLMIAIAPTATIASIAGCYECIEPQISNLFKRETLSGDRKRGKKRRSGCLRLLTMTMVYRSQNAGFITTLVIILGFWLQINLESRTPFKSLSTSFGMREQKKPMKWLKSFIQKCAHTLQ